MAIDLENAHRELWDWCREHNFAGYDPFDALNSRFFQATPLKYSRAARIAWTQLFKRSPFNLRSPALVPAGKNSKGTALFALAALADFRRLSATGVATQVIRAAEDNARSLLAELLQERLESKSGAACWGYNFDWQGRAFFAPRGTPTVVPTAFAARALVEAANVFGDERYLHIARSACDFILRDLNRSDEANDTICFSYSPQDRTRIFNASLLAAETLAVTGALTGEKDLCDLAIRAARYVLDHQRADGSWAYGADDYQSWADNFHTAFLLTSLSRIIRALEDTATDSLPLSARGEGVGGEDRGRATPPQPLPTRGAGPQSHREFVEAAKAALRLGYEFWRERFFLAHGWPKYYADRLYPADAHAAGAAISTLVDLHWLDPGALDLAARIARWTIENLRDRHGFFYYQRRRFHTVRTPYMRWSEGWMLYGLSRLLEGKRKKEKGKKAEE